MKILGIIYVYIKKFWNRFIWSKIQVKMLKKHGKKVIIMNGSDINYSNVEVGDQVYIGPSCRFISPVAKIIIGNNVMIGPEVLIITESHLFNIPGILMVDIAKNSHNNINENVVIHNDVWIGARVTILKGVTIGEGSVIGASAIITKDIAPYSIVYGGKEFTKKERFSLDDFNKHKDLIKKEKL